MSLEIAVERLYEMGWSADGGDAGVRRLPDGRPYPSVAAVQREFAGAGLKLSLKRNALFNCAHASWGRGAAGDAQPATAVGGCEEEAAVYALAQLLAARQEQGLAAV